MPAMRWLALLLVVCTACSAEPDAYEDPWGEGKGDGFGADRQIEVVLTEPFCDVCTASDKALLVERSPVTRKLVALLDAAGAKVDIRTSRSACAIEEAVLLARLAASPCASRWMPVAERGNRARPLAAGVDVRFIASSGSPAGLRHASSCSSTS
jgi:hypothetical protein